MIVRPHTGAGLIALIEDRIDRLQFAGGQFDEGNPAGAREMAVHIRELVHQTSGSPALINQLGVQHDLAWVDTAGVTHPRTVTSAACLTLMKIGRGSQRRGEYIPKFDLYPPAPIRTRDGGRIDRGSRIPFEHWWTNPVLKDPDGLDYSRKQLVLALAHGQVGTTDDPEMKAAYRAVAGSRWLGWVVSDGTATETDRMSVTFGSNPLMASVRQIGYEVVQTIRQQRDLLVTACAPDLASLSVERPSVPVGLPTADSPGEPVPSTR